MLLLIAIIIICVVLIYYFSRQSYCNHFRVHSNRENFSPDKPGACNLFESTPAIIELKALNVLNGNDSVTRDALIGIRPGCSNSQTGYNDRRPDDIDWIQPIILPTYTQYNVG
jgi:hypothetical protein